MPSSLLAGLSSYLRSVRKVMRGSEVVSRSKNKTGIMVPLHRNKERLYVCLYADRGRPKTLVEEDT